MAESLVCAYDTNRIGHRQGGGKLSLLGEGDNVSIPFQEGKLIVFSFGRRQFAFCPTGDFRGLVY